MAERILIVDDEEIIRDSISFILQKENYDVETAENGMEALTRHLNTPFDIVITDLEMPEMKGIELLERIHQATPETFVIIITAFASVESAISALRSGAFDYLIKPIDFDDLLFRINRIKAHKNLILENNRLKKEINQDFDSDNIIGKSQAMKKVFEIVQYVSNSCGNVIIYGKSGTGKELIARAIHRNSPRKDYLFVPVNCGAIVETLFESELFGHKKGAFTDAICDKEGFFKLADKGTLFLDEISEIPLSLQVKLLRAIEMMEIYPVGDSNPLKVDVRIIASTNKDLNKLVEEGKFREDLYYRLNVVQINLPSLSERKEDIPLLINYFIQKYNRQMNKNIRGVENDALKALINHTWKGEVRELENAIERSMIFASGEKISLTDLPENIINEHRENFKGDVRSLDQAIKEFEKNYIEKVLKYFNNDKEKTARALNISVSTLYRRLQELGIVHKEIMKSYYDT